jgi:hypothetical protein
MIDDSKFGTDWQDDELDAIVADYFKMLDAELAEQQYNKTQHRETLMAQIGRTHGSVEFKHQNISAVLDQLGLPWIPGYKPARNYQDAIFDAIDRYLSEHPSILQMSPGLPTVVPAELFVPLPHLSDARPIPIRLQRLVRKFDPVERDLVNRSLGRAGEEFVVTVERRQLEDADRTDLARQIRWVSAEDGDGAGYDIRSFNSHGDERLIEVKTTNGSARTPFFVSRTESDLANERPDAWCIYRVHRFAQEPHIFTIVPPLEGRVHLRTEIWRASF